MRFSGLVVVLLTLPLLFECNHIKDVQPEDKDIVPSTAVQAIKKSYPEARDFIFESLIKGELWVVDFSVDNTKLRTQVNDSAIVSSIYERLPANFATYKALTDKCSIRGGEFSDLLRYAGDTSSARIMKYHWQGDTYFLEFQKDDFLFNTNRITLVSPDASLPCYVSEQQLPEKARQFFQDNNVGLKYRLGQFAVSGAEKKIYRVYALNYDFPFFFDDDGDLIWSLVANNPANSIYSVKNSELGYPAILAKTDAMYAGFDTLTSGASKTDYNGIISLRFLFRKQTGESLNPDGSINMNYINEISEVYFNANTSDLILNYYRAFIKY